MVGTESGCGYKDSNLYDYLCLYGDSLEDRSWHVIFISTWVILHEVPLRHLEVARLFPGLHLVL